MSVLVPRKCRSLARRCALVICPEQTGDATCTLVREIAILKTVLLRAH